MARILIVDDDPISLKVLRSILQGAGHEVIEAGDGDEALALYRENPTDLVITDIFMPGKEGVETVRELKEGFPDARVIAVSGGSSGARFESLDWVKAFGVKHTFTKPFDREAIVKAVEDMLG